MTIWNIQRSLARSAAGIRRAEYLENEAVFEGLRKRIASRLALMNALLSVAHEERCTAERVIRLAGQMDGALDEIHDHIVALREHCAGQMEKAGRR